VGHVDRLFRAVGARRKKGQKLRPEAVGGLVATLPLWHVEPQRCASHVLHIRSIGVKRRRVSHLIKRVIAASYFSHRGTKARRFGSSRKPQKLETALELKERTAFPQEYDRCRNIPREDTWSMGDGLRRAPIAQARKKTIKKSYDHKRLLY
jgi:hypothetical protein